MVTQAEIAARCGVSKAAVSFALRGFPNVSPVTRDRIRRMAEEMKYRPNPLVAAHMAQIRAHQPPRYRATIGFIFDGRDPSADERELHARYFQGCRQRGSELGFRVERFDLCQPELSESRLSRILVNRGIQGVVIAPLCFPRTSLRLTWNRFSSAALGHSLQTPGLHRACHHNFHTMERLMRELIDLGYRRIGLAMAASADTRVNHLWFAGYLAQCRWTPGLAQIPPLITPEWNGKALQEWVQMYQLDALISSTTAGLTLLRQHSWRVPREIGFVNVFWTKTEPECSGVDQNFELIGAAAIDLVVGQLNANERGIPDQPKVVLVDGKLVRGKTLRSRKGAVHPPKKPQVLS